MNKKPHAREASGAAYTMFTPDQVKQFKEAFNMIDQDGDGRVTEDDLRVMLSNLGTSSYLILTVLETDKQVKHLLQLYSTLYYRHDPVRKPHQVVQKRKESISLSF
jgi:Ca2+-binding EF-hand superfamily protein